MEELQAFRQFESKTPGHPEYGLNGSRDEHRSAGPGLCQWRGHGHSRQDDGGTVQYGRAPDLCHYIYGIVSDGDLMEGIASEAASLAGHLGLGNLIYIYDDNEISIEGSTELAFTEESSPAL